MIAVRNDAANEKCGSERWSARVLRKNECNIGGHERRFSLVAEAKERPHTQTHAAKAAKLSL